jgi:hypothetical protein
VAANGKVRRAYEGSFVTAFKAVGAKARPGYEVLPGGGSSDVKALKKAVGRSGADGVVVTHLVGERAAAGGDAAGGQLDPSRSGSLYPYYQRVYGYVTQPGYYANFPALRLETNLYDAAREQLVWSARSPPMDPGSETTTINEVIADATRRLADAGYLSR